MKEQITLLKYISVVQRNTQRYFDVMLEEDHIGSGQQFFILRIRENEGMTMNELARTGSFDKGTVTKAVKKLQEAGYIRIEQDEEDGRVKHLYTTDRAEELIRKVYRIRDQWLENLMVSFGQEEKERLKAQLKIMSERSCCLMKKHAEEKGETEHAGN